MKTFLKLFFVTFAVATTAFLYYCNLALGTSSLCWLVMILMLYMLGADEENYQRRLRWSKKFGLCIQFKCLKIVKIINIDYFKLGCEKAFEWSYVAILWLNGMNFLFKGLGLSTTNAMYAFNGSLTAVVGIAWCLPALVYYSYKKKWFNANEVENRGSAAYIP